MTTVLSLEHLMTYWSAEAVAINLVIFMNLVGALLLGLLVGYERTYHGRAAGMRTYGLVCMASAALTVVAGQPAYWYGGAAHTLVGADPTRVIQGIVTGVGFLGAGVIMKEGLTISGLTTAASIWAASAIGVLVGVGFYASAMLLSVLSAASMMWMSRLEAWLPSRQAIGIVLRFGKAFHPDKTVISRELMARGYEVAWGSLLVHLEQGQLEWRFVAVALGKGKGMELTDLSHEVMNFDGIESFHLSPARN
jgi:putative Mg2+ transporter-C (MgtC) family protein